MKLKHRDCTPVRVIVVIFTIITILGIIAKACLVM